MAVIIDELKLPITPYEARDYIQKQTDDFGVFFDMERCFELNAILFRRNYGLVRKMHELADTVSLDVTDKDSVIRTLRDMGVNGSEFHVDGSDAALNDKVYTAILNNANYSERIRDFVSTYSQYKSNNRNIGYFHGLANLPQSVALDKNNHRMSIGHPTWRVLSTSRLSAASPGVQGIPRATPEIVTEPKGYTLLRADSGQIEPRINFSYFVRDELIMNLIMHYNDAYFGIWRFCTMSSEEEEACRKDFGNFKHIEVDDEVKARRQDIKTLTNAGSYGSANLDRIDPTLAAAYDKKIVHHPMRLALEAKVSDDIAHGVTTFYGAFGTPVTPDSTERYTKGSTAWNGHLLRCGINNPVQTTASELMLCSVNKAREILAHAKDTHICFYKHDEACFYVSDADVKEGILEELKDITAYRVKGWIPIEADPEIGVKHGNIPVYFK